MKRLKLDYATLASRRPDLIYCSISGFGQSGPRADHPAYAPVVHAASGYDRTQFDYQGDQDRPAKTGIFVADVLAAAMRSAPSRPRWLAGFAMVAANLSMWR
jgi:crotonobetainyl-CoA:carnitine CoA-transferase CaiB-like acyl-CoA transferase